jgi:putative protease
MNRLQIVIKRYIPILAHLHAGKIPTAWSNPVKSKHPILRPVPMKRPELLSPAGSLEHMRFAYAYGADAVYAGQPRYSLRVRNNEFSKEDILAKGIEEAHSMGKLFFLASNIAPHNAKLKTYINDLEPIIDMRPDALIMSDPGLIMMVRERWPQQTIHLSVQSNVVNYAAVKFWQSMGLKRIILSRELSLKEIGEIREQCPDIELETFVHGALCIAYSGRCLLSGYMSHRDSNQGACTNSCRWKYDVHQARETGTGDTEPLAVNRLEADQSAPLVLLEEQNRPGELMPAYEDEHGTYIMNSKDLRAVQHVEQLTHLGIDSFKIEGRTKSIYYVARTTQVYRRAIDDALAGRPFDMGLMDELEGMANRGFTEGFYRRHPPGEYQNYERGFSSSDRQQFVGSILDSNDGWLTVDVKNRFEAADQLQLMTTKGNVSFKLPTIADQNGNTTDVAPGSGHTVKIPLPDGLDPACIDEFSLLIRYLPQHLPIAKAVST